MVCSLGSGRMAVMARLLAAGNLSQSVTEEVGRGKLAAQLIFKELSEAVEPNLLDEEDMHVFGLKPMADPLHLVCCKTCKKPVKASQYAAHSELCRISNSTEQSTLDVDGSVRRYRKPTKKERKKSVTAFTNQAMTVQELERCVGVDDGQIAVNSSCCTEAKTFVDSKTLMDNSGVSPGHTFNSVSVTPRPTKRSKLIGGNEQQPSGHVSSKQAMAMGGGHNDGGIEHKKNGQVQEWSLSIKDVPAPIATKIYYSQRNNRLRSALCHLYYDAEVSSKEFCSDAPSPELSNGNTYQSQTATQKMDSLSLPPLTNHDQSLSNGSEAYLGPSGVYLPPGDFSNQLAPDNTSARPQVASGGQARNKYLSKPYSLTGNSGQSLGTVQQQNGSVPVL